MPYVLNNLNFPSHFYHSCTNQFRHTTSEFHVAGHHKGDDHICITCVPESQMSVHFVPRQVLFELQFILGHSSGFKDAKMAFSSTRLNVNYMYMLVHVSA